MENPVINTTEFSSSNSVAPDLDWSQVRETVKMLHLAITHVSASMRDGDESVESLSHSFTSIASNMYIVNEIFETYKDKIDSEDSQALKEKCDFLTREMQSAIVAFQFYDRLSQQLDHVCFSLKCLADIVSDPKKIYHPYEWHALQNQIRSAYRMNEQREIFDALMNGETVDELLEKLKNQREQDDDSDIELF